MPLPEFLKKFFQETPIIIIQPDGTKLKATVEQSDGKELKVSVANPLPIETETEYEVGVITAQENVTILGVPPAWVKYTHYDVGDEISAGSKGYKYICIVEGSSSGSGPEAGWPDVIGATAKDGGTSTLWWECAAGNPPEYSNVIDVRNAKSIFLTIINHTVVHNLKAIILTSYDGEHFDSPDASEAVVTVDTGEDQKSCAITPGMAYLKVGLLKAYSNDTTASSILTIRK